MAFGSQMHHCVRLIAFEQLTHLRRIGDVGAHEGVARIVRHWCERVEVARVGELVDHQHLVLGLANDSAYHRGADESRAAGHEDAFGHQWPSYLNGETKSAKRVSLRSLSDRTSSWDATGHVMASVGSFQISPLSLSGA